MTRITFSSVAGVMFLGLFAHPFWAAQPNSGMWTNTGNLVAGRAAGSTATLLHGGAVLVAGGTALLASGEVQQFSSAAEVYDPKAGGWTSIAPMKRSRADHTATQLNNGAVLVTGGNTLLGGPPFVETLAAAEL